MNKKRLIYALFVLLLVPVLSFLYIRRVTYVSQRFVLPKHEIYALHDQVQFGKTYISDPRVEFSDGYSLTVLEANAYTMRDYLQVIGSTEEAYRDLCFFQGRSNVDTSGYIISLKITFANASNTETGIDTRFWRLVSGVSAVMSDPNLFTLANNGNPRNERFRFDVGQEKTLLVPFRLDEDVFERFFQEQHGIFLNIALYPIRKDIYIS